MGTDNMRVLMTGVDPETRGGMWTVASGYLNSRAYRKAVDVEYVATSTRYDASVLAKLLRAVTSLSKVRRLLGGGRYDLVHAHMSERGSFFRVERIVRSAREAGVPVVLHMHGGSFDSFYGEASEGLRDRIRETLQAASCVIVLGGRFADMYREIGVDTDRLVILSNAVEVPRKNGYNPTAPDVTYLGLISQDKGIPEYLDALTGLRGTGKKFALFGPKGDIDPVAEIGARGLEGIATYGGFLEMESKEEQLSRSCALVLPSHFEVFPMCVIEAMAHGVPVVSTCVGSVPEAVEDGVSGLLVPPRDADILRTAIERLLGDETLRLRLSAAGYETARARYSMDCHVARLLEVYRAVVEEGE